MQSRIPGVLEHIAFSDVDFTFDGQENAALWYYTKALYTNTCRIPDMCPVSSINTRLARG